MQEAGGRDKNVGKAKAVSNFFLEPPPERLG
jgi:hypothetical protein